MTMGWQHGAQGKRLKSKTQITSFDGSQDKEGIQERGAAGQPGSASVAMGLVW